MTQPKAQLMESPKPDAPVAWVTGSGADRVGRTVAHYFAQRGHRIVLHARSSIAAAQAFSEQVIRSGGEAMVVTGDLQEDSFASQAVSQIIERFGRLDVLVNAAAIWEWKSFERTTAEDVRKQFSVNALGTFLCSQAAGLQMVKQPSGGAILLIGDWAVQRPYADFSAYFASKGTIETMTRSLAIELATRNPAIRVNAIMPGPVMLDESISETQAEQICEQSLLKRRGQPEHIAQAAYFLATHEFITGVCLNVDGGRSIYSKDSRDAIAHPTFRPATQ